MFRIRVSLLIALLAVLISVAATRAPLAAQNAAADLARDDRWPMYGPVAEAPDAPVPNSAPAADRPDPAYTRLVYARFRAGSWELVAAAGDGSNANQITNTPTDELMPALNRGATRLAYVSDAGGAPNIYVANADGSAPQRLTNATDRGFAYWPQWSPDGRQIVYYQGSNNVTPHIFVMNADGSNKRRLTDEGEWNGYPSWSPDGGSIIYSSRRDGGYRIWLMNADGSNKRRLNDLRSSIMPFIVPDGSQFAYVADENQNGWPEVYGQMLSGTTTPYDIYRETQRRFYDLRGFSPDGSHLMLNDILVRIVGNQLVIEDMRVRWLSHYLPSRQPTNAVLNDAPSVDGTLATTDLTAPVIDWVSWPAYAPADGGATLAWQHVDLDGSRVRDVQVDKQSNIGDGSWQPILRATSGISTTLAGRWPGELIGLRLRAQDMLYNISPWRATPLPAITFYGAHLRGNVSDMRGAPLPGALPTLSAHALTGHAAADGSYDLYSIVSNDVQTLDLTLTRSGYGTLPAATPSRYQRRAQHDFVLPPPANAVANGQFESGLSGWQTVGSGGSLASAADDALSGRNALRLGQPPTLVGSNAADVRTPLLFGTDGYLYFLGGNSDQLLLMRTRGGTVETVSSVPGAQGIFQAWGVETSDGKLHIVRLDPNPPQRLLLYAYTPAGSWEGPTTIALQAGDVGFRRAFLLQADARGGYHLAWRRLQSVDFTEVQQIVSVYRAPDGSVTPVATLAPGQLTTDDAVVPFGLTVLDDGTALITWGAALVTRNPAGLNRLVRVPTGTQLPAERPVTLHVNRRGQVAASAMLFDGYSYTLLIGMVQPDGTLAAVTLVPNLPDGAQAFLDDDGVVHLLYRDRRSNDAALLHDLPIAPGRWVGAPVALPDSYGDLPFTELSQWLFHNGATTALVNLTSNAFGDDHRLFVRYWDAGKWTPTQELDWDIATLTGVKVLQSAGGQLLLLRTPDNSNWQLGRMQAAAQPGRHGVRQTLSVPAAGASAGAPTLSLRYRLDAPVAAGGGVRALIDDGSGTPTELLRGATFGGWQHAWADLTPWAGQTVTLLLVVDQAAATPATGVLVDEVTVGAAFPDLRVTLRAPANLLPGQQGAARIGYANAGGVAAANPVVTLTLPPGLTLVAADPAPQAGTLRWPLAALAAFDGGSEIALTLAAAADAPAGATLRATARISGGVAEAELGNNEAPAAVLVGMRVYVPVLRR